MRARIVEVGRPLRRTLTTLLILGEDAENPDFILTVKEALRELLPSAATQNVSTMILSGKRNGESEPLYLAARGAAEFAKRAQEAPAGCKERAHCAVNRIPRKNHLSDRIPLGEQQKIVELEL